MKQPTPLRWLPGALASLLGQPAAVFGFLFVFTGMGWIEQVEVNTFRPAPLWLYGLLLAAVAGARFALFRYIHSARSARGRHLLDDAYWRAELVWWLIVPFTLLFAAGVEGNLFGFFVFPVFMAAAVGCTLARRSLLRQQLQSAYDAGALR